MTERTPDSKLFQSLKKYCGDEPVMCTALDEAKQIMRDTDRYVLRKMSEYRKKEQRILSQEEESVLTMCATHRRFLYRIAISAAEDQIFIWYAKEVSANIDALLLVHGIMTE